MMRNFMPIIMLSKTSNREASFLILIIIMLKRKTKRPEVEVLKKMLMI